MNRLACPFCGPRELQEFCFHKTLPSDSTEPFARIYLRIDRPDRSLEHWQHVEGCRAWLLVERNPSTGEVLDVRMLGVA